LHCSVMLETLLQTKSKEFDESDWRHHILKGPVHSAKRNINHMK
jgi:hypothetical protein